MSHADRPAQTLHAERLAREAWARLGWTEADLNCRRKGDPGKVALARQLRRETTMTLAWRARRWQMGTTEVGELR